MSSSLILHNKPFFNRIVTCDEKWILHNNWQWLTQWLDWEAPEPFSKPNLHQKNVMVTVWWPAAHMIHYSFRNPGEPLHLRSMFSKSMRCPENCKAVVSVDQQKGPKSSLTTCHTTKPSEVEQTGQQSLASFMKFTWPVINWLPLF